MKKTIFVLFVITLTACDKCPDVTGRWHTPINGMENMTQGFELRKGGVAESINMATLLYKTWELKNCDTLVMTGESIGNGQTIKFTETYNISRPDKNTMILIHENGYSETYTRE